MVNLVFKWGLPCLAIPLIYPGVIIKWTQRLNISLSKPDVVPPLSPCGASYTSPCLALGCNGVRDVKKYMYMLLLYLNQHTVAYLHVIAIINKIWIFLWSAKLFRQSISMRALWNKLFCKVLITHTRYILVYRPGRYIFCKLLHCAFLVCHQL